MCCVAANVKNAFTSANYSTGRREWWWGACESGVHHDKEARTSNRPEYRGVSGARSADLTARHEVPWESRSWQCILQDQLGGHAQSKEERGEGGGEGRIGFTSQASSTAISLSTATTGLSTRSVG